MCSSAGMRSNTWNSLRADVVLARGCNGGETLSSDRTNKSGWETKESSGWEEKGGYGAGSKTGDKLKPPPPAAVKNVKKKD